MLVLGVAYKRDIDDVRESPALDVMALLLKKGAKVTYHDPWVPHIDGEHWVGGQNMSSVPYSADAVAAADCVVILTDHKSFNYEDIVSGAKAVVDTRNAVKFASPKVFKLGAPSPRS